jgi:hypothetical protein
MTWLVEEVPPAEVTRPRDTPSLRRWTRPIRGQTQPPPENDPASGGHFNPQGTTDFASATTRAIPSN